MRASMLATAAMGRCPERAPALQRAARMLRAPPPRRSTATPQSQAVNRVRTQTGALAGLGMRPLARVGPHPARQACAACPNGSARDGPDNEAPAGARMRGWGEWWWHHERPMALVLQGEDEGFLVAAMPGWCAVRWWRAMHVSPLQRERTGGQSVRVSRAGVRAGCVRAPGRAREQERGYPWPTIATATTTSATAIRGDAPEGTGLGRARSPFPCA